MMTRRFRHAAALAALAVLATGCSRDSPVEPDEQVVGSYTLMAFNGEALPTVAVQEPGGTLEIVSGSLVLRADGTFTEILNIIVTPTGEEAQEVEEELAGNFSVSGRTVSFSSPQNSWQGTASDGSIVYGLFGGSLLFEM